MKFMGPLRLKTDRKKYAMVRFRQRGVRVISLDDWNPYMAPTPKMPPPVLKSQHSVSSLVTMKIVNGWLSIKCSGSLSMKQNYYRDLISHPPLLVGGGVRLSSGQWNVGGNDLHHFWAWPIKSPTGSSALSLPHLLTRFGQFQIPCVEGSRASISLCLW